SNLDAVNDDDDSGARSAFGTKEYWNELYLGRGDFPADEYQWYFGLSDYYEYVNTFVGKHSAKILIPGIGNDPVLLDLLQKGYSQLTGTDYSDHAIERQEDILSYASDSSSSTDADVVLKQMDCRAMPSEWENKFDAVIEKGCLDAIYLSGDGNFEMAVQEFERVLKPGGILISVSGVVPMELRKETLQHWQWRRDGSDDLQAGCFVLQKAS
ncbi:MAG: hypothetical protein SGILL_007337, partial [Bacillariaceae sp.]